eukprot:TRINITY_DN281_c0_g2_i3.p1 TRINITY_DN281_c0_g2~~TRINITY_DN281_c0_g2_i3.p1  ORF type:complete len:269 (+),score=84.14 TRINITY_DN281_c0_g2_i3:79-885(+)
MSYASSIKVDVKRATGLKDADAFGKSDPYVMIKFADHEAHPHKAHTKTIRGNLNPVWDESFYFLVKDDCKSFTVEIFDKDTLKDDKLGIVTLEREHDSAKKEARQGGLFDVQHGKGQIEIYFKEIMIIGGVDGVEQLKSENLQLLKVQINKAFNLKTEATDITDPYARLAFTHLDEGQRVSRVRTKTVRNNRNPVWDETLEVCVPASVSSLRVELFDHNHLNRDEGIGYVDVDLSSSSIRDHRFPVSAGEGDLELSYEKHDVSSFFLK